MQKRTFRRKRSYNASGVKVCLRISKGEFSTKILIAAPKPYLRHHSTLLARILMRKPRALWLVRAKNYCRKAIPSRTLTWWTAIARSQTFQTSGKQTKSQKKPKLNLKTAKSCVLNQIKTFTINKILVTESRFKSWPPNQTSVRKKYYRWTKTRMNLSEATS